MSSVVLEDVSKGYDGTLAVRNVTLRIGDGEFVTLLGASGSGKTTCLRMIAGYIAPSSGKIHIGGRDVTAVPARRRNAGMVFQSYALFPHLTVEENIAFGLKIRKLPTAEIATRTQEVLRLVQLEKFARRYPGQLSGGQKQRVALARAVVIKPDILLLDEPLAALDLKLREELQVEIKAIQVKLGITTLFVTHDQKEALSMSDRVVVMRDGMVLQADTPLNVYERPTSRYVANFVGRTNLMDGTVVDRLNDRDYVVELAGPSKQRLNVAGASGGSFEKGSPCILGFRPEAVRLGNGHENSLQVNVTKATYSGNEWLLECVGPDGLKIIVAFPGGADTPSLNSTVTISWPKARTLLLKPESVPPG